MTGNWKKLHSGELHVPSPNFQITKNQMGGACSLYGKRRGACRILVGKLNGTKPLGWHRYRREDTIKMDFQQKGRRLCLDWYGSEQGQVAGTCERGGERSVSIKCWNLLTNRGTVRLSRTVLCASCSSLFV